MKKHKKQNRGLCGTDSFYMKHPYVTFFFDWNYYFCHHIYRELDDWKGEGVRY